MSASRLDVLGLGEPMALLESCDDGPMERSTHFELRLAGAEVNLLIGVSRLGHDAGLLGAVGDDPFGRFAVRTLRDEGVDVEEVTVDPERPTGVFFKEVTGHEHRRVFYYRDGSAAAALPPTRLEALERRRPRMLVVSGLTLGLGREGGLGATARAGLARAQELGITTVFDANLRPRLWEGEDAARQFDALVDDVDLLLAGRDELEVLMPDRPAEVAAAALVDRGCQGVIVKDGAEGSVAVDSDGATVVPALPVADPVDPVGAGDAFGAGVVAGRLRGWDLVASARLGSVMGAAVVSRRGDWEGVPDDAEAKRLLALLDEMEVAG
jgi:2-dehydro-3-deoxygluconokinase